MQTHEYYEELCALLAIGQLSAEEYRDLVEHLKACPGCRNATGDFSVILDKMPVGEMDVDEQTLLELQGGSYRERFVKRAVAEGVPFSDAVMRSRFSIRKWSWPRLRLVPAMAAAALIIIGILSVQVLRLSRRTPESSERRPTAQTETPLAIIASRNSQRERLVSELEAKVATLEGQTVEQQRVISALKARLSESHANSEAARQALAQATGQLAQLQNEANRTKVALASTKADLERLRSDKDSLDATLVVQQTRINDLVAEVRQKEALAERERQLSSVAKDVRELMGARNLHILDVSDVDGNGRSKKSFGRVFLVEGKELVFYAFDLGDRGNPAKVSFQAWGQLEGHQTSAKNLGIFYVDDHAQKRWVLKVSDPTKLSDINSLFVTVEPLGGASRPTGKKLLYAYLGTPANHP
jgi:uncharacterized coiled-coil protein SlyX